MANIDVSNDVSVNIELSEEEVDVLRKAYDILKEVSRSLWQSDADETETFGNVSSAQDGIYYFLKYDCNVNVDEKRIW